MPILKGAKKALRQSKKRYAANQQKKNGWTLLWKKFKKTKDLKQLPSVYSTIDKLVKKGLVHTNKAARIKKQATKLAKKTTTK